MTLLPKIYAMRYGAEFHGQKTKILYIMHARPENPVVFEIRRIRE